MGLEVLIKLHGEYDHEKLDLPETMACNVTENETLIVPSPIGSQRFLSCDTPPREYSVPKGVRNLNFEVIFSDWESGCLDIGRAIVICGLNGEKLTPRYVRREALPCQENILFYTSGGYTRITANTSGDVTIERFMPIVSENRETIRINHEIVWKGNGREVPGELAHYRAAVSAAIEKAKCPNCREPHYAIV